MSEGVSRRLAMSGGAALGVGLIAAPAAADDDLAQVVRRFLDAYASKDIDALMGLLEPDVVVIGTDASEVARSAEEARRIVEADYRLWERSAFRPFRSFHVRQEGGGASVLYEAPWSRLVEGEPDFLIRFGQFWVRRRGGWRLAHSMNAVATFGRSAADLAR